MFIVFNTTHITQAIRAHALTKESSIEDNVKKETNTHQGVSSKPQAREKEKSNPEQV